MKWKRQKSVEAPVDAALVTEMCEWIQARGALVRSELEDFAGRSGVSDPVDATAIATRLAETTALPMSAPDYLGFANAATHGDDNPLFDLPVTWPQEDGSELTARMGDVVAGIRRLQPQLFDLLVEVQRRRNVKIEEVGDDYVAYARSRVPDDPTLLRQVTVEANRRMAEGSFERYALDNATGKLGSS